MVARGEIIKFCRRREGWGNKGDQLINVDAIKEIDAIIT